MHFSPLYYCGSAQEKDEDPYIVNRCGILLLLAEVLSSSGFVRNRDIPSFGMKWRRQVPSTWSWLITCSPSTVSKAWTRRIS